MKMVKKYIMFGMSGPSQLASVGLLDERISLRLIEGF